MTKKILAQFEADTTTTAEYTSTSETTIDAAVVCNTDSSAHTLQVWLSSTTTTAADVHKIYDALVVSPDTQTSLDLLVNHALPKGAQLHFAADVADVLSVTISGRTA